MFLAGNSCTFQIRFQFEQNLLSSPFVMNVLPQQNNAKKVIVSGDTSKKDLPASLPAKFKIDTKNAGAGDINVAIKVNFDHFDERSLLKTFFSN